MSETLCFGIEEGDSAYQKANVFEGAVCVKINFEAIKNRVIFQVTRLQNKLSSHISADITCFKPRLISNKRWTRWSVGCIAGG